MKGGDLVRLSESFSNSATIQDWGLGLITKVHTEYFSVDVTWMKKSWISNKIPWSRMEVVSEGR